MAKKKSETEAAAEAAQHPVASLRQWYAGQALNALAGRTGNLSPEDCALLCWRYADAMLSAEKGKR